MQKYTAKIDGMQCNMCETHINDLIRKSFNVKKVKSSHVKGESVFLSEDDIPRAELQFELGKMGYKLEDLKSEPYVKKGLFHRS